MLRMASNKLSEYLAGILGYLPVLIFIAKVTAFCASKGGRRDASSYSKQPRDQMSGDIVEDSQLDVEKILVHIYKPDKPLSTHITTICGEMGVCLT